MLNCDLIKALQKLPKNLPVCIEDEDEFSKEIGLVSHVVAGDGVDLPYVSIKQV